jgi:hypothetical protein
VTETIEEQRKVEGFGDPQYVCSVQELAIRTAVYAYFQECVAAGTMKSRMTQDWEGNTLHVEGHFRPMLLARAIAEALQGPIAEAMAENERLKMERTRLLEALLDVRHDVGVIVEVALNPSVD